LITEDHKSSDQIQFDINLHQLNEAKRLINEETKHEEQGFEDFYRDFIQIDEEIN